MEIKKLATSGTMESSDIMITIEKSTDNEIQIDLESTVLKQYGNQIREVIENTVKELGVTSAKIKAVDKGALDCTVKARVKTAVYRACDSKEYVWEVK